MLGDMGLLRMDNVGVVVDDLARAIAFFVELGLELEGETTVEGSSVDRLVGLDDVRTDIALMRTPDGHGRVELTKFQRPAAVSAEPKIEPANALGIRRIMFAVEDIEDVGRRLPSRRPARWRADAVRGQIPALLRPRPGGHPRRAGRATQMKGSTSSVLHRRWSRRPGAGGIRSRLGKETSVVLPIRELVNYAASCCTIDGSLPTSVAEETRLRFAQEINLGLALLLFLD